MKFKYIYQHNIFYLSIELTEEDKNNGISNIIQLNEFLEPYNLKIEYIQRPSVKQFLEE